jgi:poly(3-hydroxybutyrate) depolymerase
MRWRGCEAEVVLVSSDIGGHTWYGYKSAVPYELAVGETDMSIDNNEVLWGFFAAKRLPR